MDQPCRGVGAHPGSLEMLGILGANDPATPVYIPHLFIIFHYVHCHPIYLLVFYLSVHLLCCFPLYLYQPHAIYHCIYYHLIY